ncbi:MAG: ABC transporter substrate-binding protein [Bacteroidia bacterium]|nr:ABC transporter substrate-binding protein [Bacteroidia bacterium]
MHRISTVLLLLICFFIFSCGSDEKTESTDSEDLKVFRYNQTSGISSLDPAFARDQANIWAINQLYNGLLQLDNDLEIQPSIASKWKISQDGLRYKFTLRDDVFFHDNKCFAAGKGRRVVASDFVYSFNRIIDPETASPGSWIFSGNVREQKPFEALNDTVFIAHLKQAFRPFLSILTMQYSYVVPKEAIDMYGETFRSNPVGSGPFYFKHWEEAVNLTFLKNPNYFETANGVRLPHLDGVQVSFIENPRTAYLKFVQGELDFISGLDDSYKNDLIDKDGELQSTLIDKVIMHKLPYLNVEYLGFLLDDSKIPDNPLTNKYLRQAINYAFDREKLVRFLRNNIGKPATSGFVPPGLPSFDEEKVKGYTYDLEKARLLLQKAGYPNGEGLPVITLMTNTSYENIGVFVANQLQDVGIQVDLDLVPPAFLRELMSKSEAPFFRGSWIADYPDAESYFVVLYGKNGAPPNYTRFNNMRFNVLYEKALVTNDDEARYNTYREMDKIIIEEAPVVPLYYDEVLRFVRKEVVGLEANALNLLVLKNCDFRQKD